MCSEHNVWASPRQAVFSCGVGPDCAAACERPASTRASEIASDFTLIDLVMDHLFERVGFELLKAPATSSKARSRSMPCSWHPLIRQKPPDFRAYPSTPIFMGC